MNFFEMLVLSKKLSFADGRVMFYGQDISVYPFESLTDYMIIVAKDQELVRFIYATAKNSILEYKQNLVNAYTPSNGADWVTKNINLYGLGNVNYETPGPSLAGELSVDGSPFIEHLKNKVDGPVETILRGLLAGIVSSVLNADYDVIELKCQALGDPKCKLVIDTKEKLMEKFPSESKSQIL